MDTEMKEDLSLTDLLFFDTDVLSSFLCIDEEYLLPLLYKNRIVVPRYVYMEMCRAARDHGVLKRRLDKMIKDRNALIKDIEFPSSEFDLYRGFVNGKNELNIAIGKGEASCLSLAITYGGIVVSNNLRDVKGFIDLYDLRHMTTASILKEAYDKRIISEEQGNRIWTTMIDEKRKIGPYQDFTSYLDSIS